MTNTPHPSPDEFTETPLLSTLAVELAAVLATQAPGFQFFLAIYPEDKHHEVLGFCSSTPGMELRPMLLRVLGKIEIAETLSAGGRPN